MALSKSTRWFLLALLTFGIAIIGYFVWRHGKLYPSTEDAYVDANTVRVATQVSGRVTNVHVRDHEQVRAEQPLFDLDRRPFELAVAQAAARLQLAKQGMGSDVAAVRAAEAEMENQKVLLEKAQRNARRVADLYAKGFVSVQAHDDAIAAVDAATAQLEVAQARRHQAELALGGAGDQNQRIREAQAALKQAELDLAHTRVTAACEGQVAQMTLQPGNAVREGVSLFALVCTDKFWIEANFKETQLERIRIGQPVDITIDMYPGQRFEGRVENISRASGVAFSLLPPQNATGNWVKVTQRVPVRVGVRTSDPNYPLRVGTSASVKVDTTVIPNALANSP